MMVGYDQALKAYRLYHFTKYKIFITKDVKFNESKMATTKPVFTHMLPAEVTIIPLQLQNEHSKSKLIEHHN